MVYILFHTLKMSYKLSSPTIIVHSLCFFTVLLLSLLLIAYNLFHTAQNNRFSLKDFLKPSTLLSILKYRDNPGLSCCAPDQASLPPWLTDQNYQLIAPLANSQNFLLAKSQNNLWSITIATSNTQTLHPLVSNMYFPGTKLVTSYTSVNQQFMYPDCADSACYIYIYDLPTGAQTKIPAFMGADKLPRTHIRDVFFDESRGLISYGVSEDPLSPRVIINTREELIQTINETPSAARHLSFKFYLPVTGLLVYTDPVNQMTYFYRAEGIGLYRSRCPT